MDSSIAIRIAACDIVRTRFAGRADLEREAKVGVRDGNLVALVKLEYRLGLATEADVGRAVLVERHRVALMQARVSSCSNGPIWRAVMRCRTVFGVGYEVARAQLVSMSNPYASFATLEPARGATRVSPTSRDSWPRAAAERPFRARLAAYKAARLAECEKAARERIEGPLVAAYEQCGYRRSGKWAGGEHSVLVRCAARVSVLSDTTSAWSANGKWSGLNSSHTLSVRMDWIERVADRGAAVAVIADGDFAALDRLGGGMVLVLDLDPVTGQASWVQQGRGTSIEVETGWLVRVGKAWHCATSERAVAS